MKRFSSAKEVDDFVKQRIRESETERGELSDYQNLTRSYYLGSQWLTQRRGGSYRIQERIDRKFPNYAAEQGPIRAVVNRTTRNTINVASATNPEKFEVDATYSPYNVDSDVRNSAYAIEAFTNKIIESSSLLDAARRANFERTVCGVHGVGVCIEGMGGDKKLRCFDFDASRLALDPGVTSMDLRDHQHVVYSEVVTIYKLKRMFGEEWVEANIQPKKLNTVGQLMPLEVAFARISNGGLYARYAEHSNTPAVRVSWLYSKDEYDRFGYLYVCVDANTGEPLLANEGDTTNPYGGCGLPFVLLRGHTRPGTRLPISDVGMMMGDQDRLNLLATLFLQQAYNYVAGQQWIVDKRAFGRQKSDPDAISEEMNRRVILMDGSSNAAKPELITPKEPSANLQMLMQSSEDSIRQQGFRSEASEGRLKSHVPTTVFQQTQDLANLPLDDRISSDVMAYESLIEVMAATGISLMQGGSPRHASLAVAAGLSNTELGYLSQVNPYELPVHITLRQQAIRKRSRAQRRQDLVDAVSMQAVTPEELRFVMAQELDTPLSEGDKRAAKYASLVATQVRDGEEYVPASLGEYSGYVIRAMRWLLMEDRTAQIDGAKARLEAGIVAQRMHDVEQEAEIQQMLAGGQQDMAPPPPDNSMATASMEEMLMGANLDPQTFA